MSKSSSDESARHAGPVRERAWLGPIVLAAALFATACEGNACVRESDCASGLACRAGRCIVTEDAAGGDAAARDAGASDAGRDAAAVDAGDAGTDAGTDTGTDAG